MGAKPQAASETPPQAAKTAKPQAAAEDSQKLHQELAAAKDRELRVHAELDNYRKWAARELDEHRRYANLSLLRDLLPVLDNVDRRDRGGR